MPLTEPRRLAPRPLLRAALGYLALAALFYLPQLLGIRAFPEGDFTQHFLPFALFQRAEILAGRLAVWNPYTYGGHPFLADVQSAVYYPIGNLVLGLTLPFGSVAARLYFLEVEAALHLALAGFFTYLFVHELTGRQVPAFLAGCVFAFSGYLTGYPPLQLAVLRTAVWLPLVFWLVSRAVRARRTGAWRRTLYAALAYASAFLAGHSQTFLFVSYGVLAWWLFCSARSLAGARAGERRDLLWLHGRQMALYYAVFLALSAAQLWPSLEFTAQSVRANVDYAFVSGGFPLGDTWQLLLPGVLTTYSPLYVGVVALGLALLAVGGALSTEPSGQTRRAAGEHGPGGATWLQASGGRGPVLFFALLGLVALLVSYGDNGFLYPIFYRWLPGWNLFRGQERAAYLVAFSLSVLAGYGASLLEQVTARRLRAAALAYLALVAAGIAAFVVFWALPGRADVAPGDLWPAVGLELVVVVLVAATCAGRPALRLARAGTGNRSVPLTASAILVVLAVSELFLANYRTGLGENSLVQSAQAAAARPEITAVQAAVRGRPGGNPGIAGRVHNEFRLYEDYGMVAGVEDVWGSSPLKLAHYALLFDQFPIDRMWRLLGVDFVLTWRQSLPQPSDLLAEFPQAKDTTYLHRLTTLNPRAWMVHRAQRVDDAAALGLLADHQFDLGQAALLAAGDTIADPRYAALNGPAPALGAGGADAVRLQQPAPGRLVADVQSEHGGLLVVSENWMPGWRATLRAAGQAASSLPVLRGDLTLLAIPVPAGSSTVDVVYRPDSVTWGLAISAAALLALAAWYALAARQRRRAQVERSR